MKSEIYLEDFEKIVSVMYRNHIEREEYVDKLREVDSYLVDYLYENTYNSLMYQERDFLAEQLLGDLWEDVMWFLYEMPLVLKHNSTWNIETGGVKYLVKDLESYMDYARHGLCLKSKPQTTE